MRQNILLKKDRKILLTTLMLTLFMIGKVEAGPFTSILAEMTVSGQVLDSETGEGLPGVNVVESGTSNGTVTDIDGKYSINVQENSLLVDVYKRQVLA